MINKCTQKTNLIQSRRYHQSYSIGAPAPNVAFSFVRRLLPSPPSLSGCGTWEVRRENASVASAMSGTFSEVLCSVVPVATAEAVSPSSTFSASLASSASVLDDGVESVPSSLHIVVKYFLCEI